MASPTQFYLTFKDNGLGDYDVYEAHRCPGEKNLWTSDEYITTCLPGKVDEFVEEYNQKLLKGKVVGYEVESYIEVKQ